MTDYTKLCEELRGYRFDYLDSESMADKCADAADTIESLQSENMDFYFTLTAVMHSVDKWLDGEELEQDEANRAAIMREKTLRIAETLQAESDEKNKRIAELEAESHELKKRLGGSDAVVSPIFQARIDKLQAERDAAVADIPHNCATCVHIGEDGEPHDEECAHCTGNTEAWNTFEDNYKWRGIREGEK